MEVTERATQLGVRALLESYGLTPVSLDVHELLLGTPGEEWTIEELADTLGHIHNTVSKALKGLVEMGLVAEDGGGFEMGRRGRLKKTFRAKAGKSVYEILEAKARKMLRGVK